MTVPPKVTGQRPQQVPTPWRAALTSNQADRALQVATLIAERLLELAPTRPVTSESRPLSLAGGDAGIALLFGYIGDCLGDASWSTAAHRYLRSAAADAKESGPAPAGLFDGLAGLGFAASALSEGGRRHQQFLNSVDHALYNYLLKEREVQGSRTLVPNFDVVSGLSGIGVYFLQRRQSHSGSAELATVARMILGDAPSRDAPTQWFTPADDIPASPVRDLFPDGYINCGLAHGVPGPLAFLARTWMCGLRIPGLQSAITSAATWMLAHRTDDKYGINWPVGIAFDDTGSERRHPDDTEPPTRAAWCYGNPGVARALWLAGVALNRVEWRGIAVDAMRAVWRRPVRLRQQSSPGLCHGVAGLLQIALRFYNDTGQAEFAHRAAELVDLLLGQFEPESAYGYRNFEQGDDPDNPGFLAGAAGVAAALLAAATTTAPAWDEMLLIA